MTAPPPPPLRPLPSDLEPDEAPAPFPAAASRVPESLLVALLSALMAVVAVFAVLFLPAYVGTVPVPVSAVLAAATCYATVRLCFTLTGSVLAAAAPAAVWLLVTIVLGTSSTLGYPLVIGDWRALLLFGLGAVAGSLALAKCWATSLASTASTASTGSMAPTASAETADVRSVTASRPVADK